MRAALTILCLGLLIIGCVQNPPIGNATPNGTSNNTPIPPGYEVKDYCQKDSDCVRLNSCCDCGDGTYVNIYHQETIKCYGHQCMCPIRDTVGRCVDNRCVAALRDGSGGFCGWSTNGTCANDSGCMAGGCSGQVCQSSSDEPVVTDCMYAGCYDSKSYGVGCGCVQGKCQWH